MEQGCRRAALAVHDAQTIPRHPKRIQLSDTHQRLLIGCPKPPKISQISQKVSSECTTRRISNFHRRWASRLERDTRGRPLTYCLLQNQCIGNRTLSFGEASILTALVPLSAPLKAGTLFVLLLLAMSETCASPHCGSMLDPLILLEGVAKKC